jgi:polysaccharide biosynthesis/export protein
MKLLSCLKLLSFSFCLLSCCEAFVLFVNFCLVTFVLKLLKMNRLLLLLTALALLAVSCTSQKKLAYLNNLSATNGEETFTINIPEYKIQPRDVLYITIKAMTPDGKITDFLASGSSSMMSGSMGDGGALFGYDVNSDGNLILPVIGTMKVSGLTMEETRKLVQESAIRIFVNSTVECKLLSFKYTVIGEVKGPGTYLNYSNYLTIFEAIGKAGGIGDLGDRTNLLVVRPVEKGTKTYRINLQDKNIITSEAYYLLPNDVIIVQPYKQKVFNANMPTISFVITTVTSVVTMTILLINYFGK